MTSGRRTRPTTSSWLSAESPVAEFLIWHRSPREGQLWQLVGRTVRRTVRDTLTRGTPTRLSEERIGDRNGGKYPQRRYRNGFADTLKADGPR
jgi:hypothetical protein